MKRCECYRCDGCVAPGQFQCGTLALIVPVNRRGLGISPPSSKTRRKIFFKHGTWFCLRGEGELQQLVVSQSLEYRKVHVYPDSVLVSGKSARVASGGIEREGLPEGRAKELIAKYKQNIRKKAFQTASFELIAQDHCFSFIMSSPIAKDLMLRNSRRNSLHWASASGSSMILLWRDRSNTELISF